LKNLHFRLKKILILFKPGDVLAYGLVVIIMVAGLINMSIMLRSGRDRLAIVELDGKVIQAVNLTQNMKPKEFSVDAGAGRYNIIFIGYNYVEVLNSNCPDQVCVGWGRIRYAGQTIVCLPFRIVIRITGRAEDASVDDVTW